MSGNRTHEWWENPQRHCRNDIRFTELPKGRGAASVIAELTYLCMTCPVVQECFNDATNNGRNTKYPTTGVVQGGQLWL